MKKDIALFVFVLMFGIPFISTAQSVDYNKIILPDNAKDLSIEERLVQLAWKNNPENQRLLKRVDASQQDVKSAGWAWADLFRFQGNLNEFTIDPESDPFGRAAFYPRYNFSVSVPFGSFAKIPIEVKRSKLEVSMNEDQVKSQKLAIRAEVLRLYTQYNLSIEQLKVQREAEQTSNANMKLVEENFIKGILTVQIYNNALQANTLRRTQLLEAQAAVSLTRIDLEQVIGVSLEDILQSN